MKRGTTFTRIFVSILILGIGLVASFGTYIYMTTKQSVLERVAVSKQAFITQTKNSLEQKVKTIEYAFSTYSTTSSFRDVIKNPITVQDFEAYRSVNTQLNYIASMGLEGAQYTLISLVKNWEIASGKLSQLSSARREELVAAYMNSRSRGLFWQRTDSGLRFVYTLPAFSSKKEAIALADLSLAGLNRILRTEDESAIVILNSQGELLYENRALGLSEAQLSGLATAAEESGAQRSGLVEFRTEAEKKPSVVFARSDYNNWIYATPLEPGETTEALRTARYGLVVMGLVITALIAVVAYFISYYFANSIRRIQRRLPAAAAGPRDNEIDWIIGSIDAILDEKQGLEQMIETELPKLETQFAQNLLRGRIALEELDHHLHRFGYRPATGCRYAVMLIQLDSYGGRDAADKDMLLLAISQLIAELVAPERRLIPIVLNDTTQATILMPGGESEDDIRRWLLDTAKAAVRRARDVLGVSVSVGFGNLYEDLALGSREACEMGKQALHQRLNLGKESIIFYEDVSGVVSGPVVLHYPAQLENALFDAIRLGDEQGVSRALYPFLAEMMKTSKDSADFEMTLIRLVNNLIQLEQLLGIQVLLTPDNRTLFQRLLQIRNPEEIERILIEEAIQPMVRVMKEKTNRQFRSLSDQVAAIVREEYDKELSLELIADRLHYNPNYLSSIFRKEFGITFSEYLMNYRLDMAKKWLIETELSVKDIAERLQYQNPQNFIRSFRKKENVTPGAYRKEQQSS
ncbi:helix-turn-helix domain-containing protein [Paenibacillus methanolicus]|uniref:Helix-turn-helix protein n=1 Tax=Paenibacillus methanolicus TaxID=582686 RepID=A0A5S5CG37_9BACL|nr:helix-turn-helix domain-containing protein [Paenibacillus methanolicus]TYP78247.1 helix-turn-helix protein [Paenibacillus methanolicus]